MRLKHLVPRCIHLYAALDENMLTS